MVKLLEIILQLIPTSIFIQLYQKLYKARVLFITLWILMSTISFFGFWQLRHDLAEYRINSDFTKTINDSEIKKKIIDILKKCGHKSYIFWFKIGSLTNYNFLSSVINKITGGEQSLVVAAALSCEEGKGVDCINENAYNFQKIYDIDISTNIFLESDETIFGSFKENEVLILNLRNKDSSLTATAIFIKNKLPELWQRIEKEFVINNAIVYQLFLVKVRNPYSKKVKDIFTLSFSKDSDINCNIKNYNNSAESSLKNLSIFTKDKLY